MPREAALQIERTARAQAQGPGLAAVEGSPGYVLAQVRDWSEKSARAEAVGVDLRKATFINKLIATGAAFITLGAVLAGTAVTGGAALPFLLVAAVRTAVLVGDCLCAYVQWKGSQESPPVTLALGASALGNMLYYLGEGLGLAEAHCKSIGRYGGGVLTVGLAASGLVLALPGEGIALSAILLRYFSSGGGVVSAARQHRSATNYEQVARSRDEVTASLRHLVADVARRPGVGDPAPDLHRFEHWCEELRVHLVEHEDYDDDALASLDKILREAWASANVGVAPPGVGADRVANIAQRTVNDVVGVNSASSLALGGLAHGGLWSAG